MKRGKRKDVACVRKAMARVGCTDPNKFFQQAIRKKSAPRGFNLDDEMKNFRNLEKGGNLNSLHKVPKVIIAYAEEVNMQKEFSETFRHFPRCVRMATCSSGRVMA